MRDFAVPVDHGERSPEDPRKFAVTQTSVKDHHLTLV